MHWWSVIVDYEKSFLSGEVLRASENKNIFVKKKTLIVAPHAELCEWGLIHSECSTRRNFDLYDVRWRKGGNTRGLGWQMPAKIALFKKE